MSAKQVNAEQPAFEHRVIVMSDDHFGPNPGNTFSFICERRKTGEEWVGGRGQCGFGGPDYKTNGMLECIPAEFSNAPVMTLEQADAADRKERAE